MLLCRVSGDVEEEYISQERTSSVLWENYGHLGRNSGIREGKKGASVAIGERRGRGRVLYLINRLREDEY